MWEEVVNLASTRAHLMRMLNSSGSFALLEFILHIPYIVRLILEESTHVFIPAVWMLLIPSQVHFFLCLLSKNKLLTRGNIEKKEI
jgi:hypothetical protein